MTALPHPGRLLTVGEYAAFGETEMCRTELVGGEIIVTPSPMYRHNRAMCRLFTLLDPQLPAGLELNVDLDVDLQLAPPDAPGTARRPDLVVVTTEEARRADSLGSMLRAEGTVLVVEIVSPGSRRIDLLAKRADYADAGIPNYWIIELEPTPSLLVCRRTTHLGYQDSGAITGRYETPEPFPIALDLTALS